MQYIAVYSKRLIMRKIVYLLALPFLFAANTSSAQSFTMQKDTVSSAASGYADIYNNLTNTTADTISVTWRIIAETLPQSWKDHGAFGLCDNVQCYPPSILTGTLQMTDTIGAGKQMALKMQFDASSSSVVPGGPYYVVTEISHGSTMDTVVYKLNKWATNVAKMNTDKDDVMLYPNPAKDEVNITFSKDLGVKTIAIYNLVGKQMAAYRTNNNSAKLDIEKIPSGIYFVRLMDNTGRVVATRRFTHQ